jgi:hypothetical protein
VCESSDRYINVWEKEVIIDRSVHAGYHKATRATASLSDAEGASSSMALRTQPCMC